MEGSVATTFVAGCCHLCQQFGSAQPITHRSSALGLALHAPHVVNCSKQSTHKRLGIAGRTSEPLSWWLFAGSIQQAQHCPLAAHHAAAAVLTCDQSNGCDYKEAGTATRGLCSCKHRAAMCQPRGSGADQHQCISGGPASVGCLAARWFWKRAQACQRHQVVGKGWPHQR